MAIKLLKPLQTKEFRWLFASQIFASLAQFLDYIALITLIIFVWHKGPATLAIFCVVFSLPMILISPLAGVIADRMPVKKIMTITTFLCFPLTLALIFSKTPLVLLSFIIVRGTLRLFYYPSEQKVIRDFFNDETLVAVNGLIQTVRQLASFIGPAICSALLFYLAPQKIFIITAVSYLISALLLYQLPNSLNEMNNRGLEEKKINYFKDISETIKAYSNERELLFALIGLALALFSIFLSDSMISLLVKKVGFHLSSYGSVVALLGVGGLLGSVIIASFLSKFKPSTLLSVSLILTGFFVVLASAITPYLETGRLVFFMIMWLCAGAGMAGVPIAFQVILQKKMPKKMLGRSSSVFTILTGVSMMFAPMIGALITHLFGIVVLFVVTGLGLSLSGIACLSGKCM